MRAGEEADKVRGGVDRPPVDQLHTSSLGRARAGFSVTAGAPRHRSIMQARAYDPARWRSR
jgi:hypothetical protein